MKVSRTKQASRLWRGELVLASIFFVLGFTLVFSLFGVLLQTVLLSVSYEVQLWLARIAGLFVILFGLYLLGVLDLPVLRRELRLFPHLSSYLSTKGGFLVPFLMGATFAIGWSPCIGPVLGAIFSLAVVHPATSFLFFLVYSLGFGLPFLLVGFFLDPLRPYLRRFSAPFAVLSKVFGALMVLIGVLVMVQQLGVLARFGFLQYPLFTGLLSSFDGLHLTFGFAFLAGLFSFFSPCVLSIVPAFLAYLGSRVVRRGD